MLSLDAERPPPPMEPGGVVRVGDSHVSLGLVLEQYGNGMTPGELVRAYDTLTLADAYAVLVHYLRHRDAVART